MTARLLLCLMTLWLVGATTIPSRPPAHGVRDTLKISELQPANLRKDRCYVVSDPASASDCSTGDGTGFMNICCSNGTTWLSMGAAAAAGEANTGSNLGGGLANFSTKVGVDLRFNSFAAADFDLGSNLITIDKAASPVWTGDHDFGGGGIEIENNAALPGACTVGQIFLDTNETSGQQLFGCEGGSFVLQGDGGGTGDVSDVGPGCATGACWTDGLVTTGTVLLNWEGTTANANDFTIIVPADPAAQIDITMPIATSTLVADNTAVTSVDGAGLRITTGALRTASAEAFFIDIDSIAAANSGALVIDDDGNGTTYDLPTLNYQELALDLILFGVEAYPPDTDDVCMVYDTTADKIEWSTVSCVAAASGDVTDVGPGCATGACWTDGVTTTGSVLLNWEGTTANANDFTIIVPADPGSQIDITMPIATSTLVANSNAVLDVEGAGLLVSGTTLRVDSLQGNFLRIDTINPAADGALVIDTDADNVEIIDDVLRFQSGGVQYHIPSLRTFPTSNTNVIAANDVTNQYVWKPLVSGNGMSVAGNASSIVFNMETAGVDAIHDQLGPPTAENSLVIDTTGDGTNILHDTLIFRSDSENFFIPAAREYPTVDGSCLTLNADDDDWEWSSTSCTAAAGAPPLSDVTDPVGDVSFTFTDGEEITWTMTSTINDPPDGLFHIVFDQPDDADATDDIDVMQITMTLESGDAGDRVRGMKVTLENGTANTILQAAFMVENNETTAGTMLDGVRVISPGVDGGIVDAFDGSAANIDNALNMGANNIVTGIAVISSTELNRLDGLAGVIATDSLALDDLRGAGLQNNGTILQVASEEAFFLEIGSIAAANSGALVIDDDGNGTNYLNPTLNYQELALDLFLFGVEAYPTDVDNVCMVFDTATDKVEWSTTSCTAAGGNSFGIIGNATADSATDTLTTTDTLAINIITTNDPEDFSATFNYDQTLASNPALGVDECIFTSDGTGGVLICEGIAADDNEGVLLWPVADSDKAITIPNVTDTLVARSTTDTLQNKTLDSTNSILTGAYNAASIDGDDINTSIAGDGLILTADTPDTLDVVGGTCITANANDVAMTANCIDDAQVAANALDNTSLSLTLNLGGATSFEIPNSGAPVVDTLGEIAIDTTDVPIDDGRAQLVYNDGGEAVVLTPVKTACFDIEDLVAGDDDYAVFSPPYAITILGAYCYCNGTCTVAGTVHFEKNRAGSVTDIGGTSPTGDVACSNSSAAVEALTDLTAGTLTLASFDQFRFDTITAPTATNTMNICWTYVVDRQ